MNYFFIVFALIGLIFAGKLLLTPPPQKPETEQPSFVEEAITPTETETSKKLREMREQQQHMLEQQKKMQQDRLNSY